MKSVRVAKTFSPAGPRQPGLRPILPLLLLFALGLPSLARAQAIDGDRLGAWYMYFYTARFGDSKTTGEKSPWGLQGDVQVRHWNLGGDLEQLLFRSGLTYTPKEFKASFTLGYAHITTGQYGRDAKGTVAENRIYQEALLPQRMSKHLLLTHRFRYEQRFNEGQDFRTRFRYNLIVNVPINGEALGDGIWYASFYNEIWINGQRDIGNGREVPFFDRNRVYLALGYGLTPKLRTQVGIMRQRTNAVVKTQLQVGLHQTW